MNLPIWYIDEFTGYWVGDFTEWDTLYKIFRKGYSAYQAYEICKYRWEV